MVPKAIIPCLIIASECHAVAGDAVERIRQMMMLAQPLQGKFSVVSSGTNQVYEIGIQPDTWYLRNPNGPRENSIGSGQSYSMTWSFGGNSVQVIPRKDTVGLVPMGKGTGLNPEEACQANLGMLHFITRFGLHIAESNSFKWQGLKFSGKSSSNWGAEGNFEGEIVVSNGLPVQVVIDWRNSGGPQHKVLALLAHDSDGFPTVIEMSNNGRPSNKSIRVMELKFGLEKFPDSDGYTPSFLGESGREFTIFYSNRTAQVIGADGRIQSQPTPPQAQAVGESWIRSRSLWLVVVGLAAGVVTAVWLTKRQQ